MTQRTLTSRIGHFVTQTVVGESYKAYVPRPLPPDPAVDLQLVFPGLERASQALATLNSLHKNIPNQALFIYMYVRKEALLSSQIEGTQSSFSDLMLFENHQKTEVSIDDVEEVSHYVQALMHGLARLREGFPLCLRLLREIHAILLSGGRGASQQPGEFRRSQNWVGGTRPGNALFVPPPVEALADCLSSFEAFLHDTRLPLLIRAGLAHVQFETIHPFLDGNGRLGRLLITLLLCHGGLLESPILYLSLYIKQHRTLYYDLLQEVRQRGTWERWLDFFLEGVTLSAQKAAQTAVSINHLFDQDSAKIHTLGRARFACLETLGYLKTLPQVTVPLLSQALGMSAPTARRALNDMVTLGLLTETTGKKRDKVYVYAAYLRLLEEGTDPLTA